MAHINYSQVDLMDYLYNLFVGKVSNQVYSMNGPTTLLPQDSNDFMVTYIPYGEDLDAFGRVKVVIELYVKSKAGGKLNLSKFKELENKLYAVIDDEDAKDTTPYQVMKTRMMPNGKLDENKEYHVAMYSFDVLIKQ